MRLFLEILLVDVLLVGFYLVMRSTFDECLTDDVAFRYGKAKAQRRKKSCLLYTSDAADD